MRSLRELHPAAQFIYFASVILISMFCANPVMYVISLVGALSFFVSLSFRERKLIHLYLLLLFAVTALINPLVSHKGDTVLFVMNDSPVTLEALLYGVSSACMIISVIYWFMCFSRIMTSDRLLYIFGALSPKLSLVLSMALRYVPLFSGYAKKVSASQKALGLYKDGSVPDRIRGGARVFSVMTTWALENGIITAESMEARGYGSGRRTFYSDYRFRACDAALIAASVLLSTGTLFGIAAGAVEFAFYPSVNEPDDLFASLTVYIMFGALSLLPCFLEIAEGVKWRYLRSRI